MKQVKTKVNVVLVTIIALKSGKQQVIRTEIQGEGSGLSAVSIWQPTLNLFRLN